MDVRDLLTGRHLAAIVDGTAQDAINSRLDVDGLTFLDVEMANDLPPS